MKACQVLRDILYHLQISSRRLAGIPLDPQVHHSTQRPPPCSTLSFKLLQAGRGQACDYGQLYCWLLGGPPVVLQAEAVSNTHSKGWLVVACSMRSDADAIFRNPMRKTCCCEVLHAMRSCAISVCLPCLRHCCCFKPGHHYASLHGEV